MKQIELSWRNGKRLLLSPKFKKQTYLKPGFYAIVIGATLFFSCRKMEEASNSGDTSHSKTVSAISTATGDEFTIAVIGDTQNYVDYENDPADNDCQTYQPLVDQLQWIADNKTTENIKYVISVGDITDNYNPTPATTESTNQWVRARSAYNILRNANVPFGVVAGNHDINFPQTTLHNYPVNPGYNSYFSRAEFVPPVWPSGDFHRWEYPSGTNENHFDIVNTPAGDLLILYFRWHHERSEAVEAYNAAYAEVSKPEYADKKIIIVTHYLITPTYQTANNDAEWGLLGHDNYYQAGEIYNKFKGLPNFFMMIGGHVVGEVQRHDVNNGITVQSYNSDYSGCSLSYEGLLRTMKFSKAKDRIEFKTFKPGTSTITNQFFRPWYFEFSKSRTNDFNNDSKSQPAFYVGAEWKITYPTQSVFYGLTGDIPVPGDYNGTGSTEPAIFRDGVWKRQGVSPDVTLGTAVGDIPVPGDYDGNGTTDCAIYRPSSNTWYVKQPYLSSNISQVYGQSNSIPVAADYDGDGKVDYAWFNPSTAEWGIYSIVRSVYGQSGDIPVPGDYKGTGINIRAVFRRKPANNNNEWYVYGDAPVIIGQNGDIPVPGDYNGDGKTDIAVYRPSTGAVIINGQSTLTTGIINAKPVNLPYHIRKFFFP